MDQVVDSTMIQNLPTIGVAMAHFPTCNHEITLGDVTTGLQIVNLHLLPFPSLLTSGGLLDPLPMHLLHLPVQTLIKGHHFVVEVQVSEARMEGHRHPLMLTVPGQSVASSSLPLHRKLVLQAVGLEVFVALLGIRPLPPMRAIGEGRVCHLLGTAPLVSDLVVNGGLNGLSTFQLRILTLQPPKWRDANLSYFLNQMQDPRSLPRCLRPTQETLIFLVQTHSEQLG